MAERLTAEELLVRLDLAPDALKKLRNAGLKSVRTKTGDRYSWPATLHWYMRYCQQSALQELPETVTQKQFARLTGKVDRTLYNWRQQGMPSEVNEKDSRRPLIPLADAVRWLVERAEKTKDEDDPAALVKLERERVGLQFDQIKIAAKRGTVVDVEFMQREFEELSYATLSVLEGLAGRLPAKLAALDDEAAIRRIIEDEVTSARDDWADAVTRVAERRSDVMIGDEEDEDDASPPADGHEDADA